jgi:hypothetical protein
MLGHLPQLDDSQLCHRALAAKRGGRSELRVTARSLLAFPIGGWNRLPQLAHRPPPVVIMAGGGNEVGQLTHDRRGELPAAALKHVPRGADTNPATVRVFRVLVSVGVDIRGQRRAINALAHA